jgi:hypothetical protein
MPTADRSYAALLQRRKGFILSGWHAANPTRGEQSPPPTDASTLTARRLGQIAYVIENAGGGTRTEGPCCGGEAPTYVYYTECANYDGPLVPGKSYIFVAQDDNAILRFRNNGTWGLWIAVNNGESYTYVAQTGDTDYEFNCD